MSNDLTSGSLWKNIIKFSIPLMLTGLLQLLYNAADVIVVGRYAGQDSLAAVGTTTSVINLMLNLFIGLSAGVSVAMARSVGAKNENAMEKVVHTAISISLLAGLIMTVFGAVATPYLLKLIDVPHNILSQAVSYMRIIFYGMIPSMIYNFGSAILRSMGDTKRPLFIISMSGILNVILNLWFVIGFKMGATGVGLATIISQVMSAILIIRILTKQKDASRLNFKKLRIDKKQLLFIVKIGVPAGIQGCSFSLANVIIQSGINSFGSACMAACTAASSIEGFMYTALNTFNQSAMTFVSQNIGAKKYDKIGKTLKVCLTYVVFLSIIITLIALFLDEMLIGIYCPGNIEAIKIGSLRLNIIGISYILCGFMDTLSGALRGMGASLSSMLMAIFGVCGIRILWLFTVFKKVGTFTTLMMCFPVSWFVIMVLYYILYRKVKKNYLNRIIV